jgi:hypothetical protein
LKDSLQGGQVGTGDRQLGDEAGDDEHPKVHSSLRRRSGILKASTAVLSRGALSMGVFHPAYTGPRWCGLVGCGCYAMPAWTATRVAPEREETWSFAKMWLR